MDPTEIGTQSTLHPRTDLSDAETPPLEQGDPWLDDGNVILEAEGKQFRVLRSILVSHSSIFRDVFALPQPADEKLVHGCPVVRISDTAEDTHHVLKAVFDRSYCSINNGPLELSVVAAFLRMGRKYEIEQLLSEAVGRLTFDFPSTLDEYDQHTRERCQVYSSEFDFEFHHFTIINLAREYNMLSILPAVFCRICSKLDIHDMVGAFEIFDGTAYALSLSDQRVMIKGRYALTGTLARRTFSWLTNEDVFTSICSTPHKCADNRKAFVVDYWLPTPIHSAMELERVGS